MWHAFPAQTCISDPSVVRSGSQLNVESHSTDRLNVIRMDTCVFCLDSGDGWLFQVLQSTTRRHEPEQHVLRHCCHQQEQHAELENRRHRVILKVRIEAERVLAPRPFIVLMWVLGHFNWTDHDYSFDLMLGRSKAVPRLATKLTHMRTYMLSLPWTTRRLD